MASQREKEATLEAALREDLPALTRAQDTLYQLGGLRERLRGTQSLAAERLRNAAGATEAALEQGRDPDELEAEAERVRAQEHEISNEVETHRGALEEAVVARRAAEDAAAEAERRVAGLQRAAADRREGLARLHGQVNALKSRSTAAEDEIGRLVQAREDVLARAERAQRDFTALETKVAGLDAGEEGLDAEHEAAVAAFDDIQDRLAKVREEAQQADRDRSMLAARKDALEMGLNRKDGAGALLAVSDQVSGLLGSVAALLTVRTGYEAAVASALGSAADAVAVADSDAAVAAIGRLKDDDLGRAGLLLGAGPDRRPSTGPRCPTTRRTPATWWSAPTRCVPALGRLLFKTAVVDDLRTARALVAELPDVTAVTRDGDVLGAHFAAGGSSAQQSLIEIQAAVDEAESRLGEAIAAAERLGFDMSRLETERQEAQQRVDVALAKLHESDATLAAVAEELGQFGSQARAARGEAERLVRAIEQAEAARDQDLAGLAELESRLSAAEEAPEEQPDTGESERSAAPRAIPASRDGGPARAADLRGAGPRAPRACRPAGARGRGGAPGQGQGGRASRATHPRRTRGRGRRCRRRAGPAADRGVHPPRDRAAAGRRGGAQWP